MNYEANNLNHHIIDLKKHYDLEATLALKHVAIAMHKESMLLVIMALRIPKQAT